MRFRSLAGLAIPLFCAALTHAAPAPLIPISAFVEEDKYGNPRLSPDGKYLAVTVRIPAKDDKSVAAIGIFTVPEMKQVSIVRMPVHQLPHRYMWVSNTRLVVSKAIEMGSEEAPRTTGELLAMNVDGSKQQYLYGYKMGGSTTRYMNDEGAGEMVGVPRPLNEHVYVQEQLWDSDRRVNRSSLYDIDTNTAIRKLVTEIPISSMRFLLQPDGVPRFAYGRDEENVQILYERNGQGKWAQVTRADVGRDFTPFVFDPSGRAFFVSYSPDGGPSVLARQDAATGERATLFKDPLFSDFYYQFGTGQERLPFAVAGGYGKPAWRYLDPQAPMAQLHKQLMASFPDADVDFVSVTDDARLVLFLVASDRDPGSYYLYDRSTNKAELLLTNKEKLDPAQLPERKPIRFTARDGLELDGILTLPAPVAGKKPALIVMPHGGPYGVRDTWYFDSDAAFLANRGYAVLQVNFRGSAGRGPNFREAGWRQWGGKIQDDLVDGIRWAAAQGAVDGSRVCAYGASFGGYSALMLAVREPKLLKCAVGYAGVYDLNLFYDEHEAKIDKRLNTFYRDTVGTDKAELDRFSPAKNADKITVPVMLVHGAEDEIAPVAHAKAMRAALEAAGRPPEWMLVEKEVHGFYNPKNVTALLERLEAFFAKHLGP